MPKRTTRRKDRRPRKTDRQRKSIAGGRWRSGAHKPAREPDWKRKADRIDSIDRDDLGESPDC